MKRQHAVKRFGKMFFNQVGVDGVPAALAELSAVDSLMQRSADFRGLLVNPLFSGEERGRAMDAVAPKLRLSDGTKRFVLYLAEQMVAAALSEVIAVITGLYLEKKKKARATVITPVDTAGKYDSSLRASLQRLTGKEVDIEYVVDKDLVGGVLVKVGSTMYDSSIKGQLRLLKDDLIKG